MIHHGDCLDAMATLDAESIDAIVTDPPYGIRFMGKAWDGADIEHRVRKRAPKDAERVYIRKDTGKPYSKSTPYADRASEAGQYDLTAKGVRAYQAWCELWATEALRVAKPGAYLLAFGGTRTVHRLASAIEDAGWIIRDMLVWAYASGFPKGRANLKPAWEPIVMARKPGPLRPLAIDECRIGLNGEVVARDFTRQAQTPGIANPQGDKRVTEGVWENTSGRWPANVILTDPILDGGWDCVVWGGEVGPSFRPGDRALRDTHNAIYGQVPNREDGRSQTGAGYGDSGTYSRFFLIPKAARSDREPVLGGLEERERLGDSTWARRCRQYGERFVDPATSMPRCGHDDREWVTGKPRANSHPTVKPTELMRHLVRLVTPPGGTVLDPFLGSGTTALAAEMEGFAWVGIEREEEYVRIAEARLNGTQRGLAL